MMNKFKKYLIYIIFFVILLLAFVTRFYKLGQAPAGLYLDEAAQGYNAYSILKTGKDEFGKGFPIIFRSFNDFKTPVYIYLITPLIPIFGLTKFTVRFPSFLFSLLTFPYLYLLISNITNKKLAKKLALLTSLLLAISPWHILFGRTNFECNVALFFFIAGSYYFFIGLNKPKYLILSALFWALAIPSYHSQRIITPIMMLVLLFKYKNQLLKDGSRKYILYGCLLGFIILLPTLLVSFTPGFLSRATTLNIFKTSPVGIIDTKSIFSFIINNKIYLNVREFMSLYISYFSPINMFVLGDYGLRSSFPALSTFFVWQAPFYFIGLYYLLKDKNLGKIRHYTISLLLIAPIPAAVTRDPYTTIRALPLVIPQLIAISLGIIFVYEKLAKQWIKIAAIILFLSTVGYSLLKLYSSVIVLNEYYRAPYWNYGWEKVVDSIKLHAGEMPVVVDDARGEPYSQIVFFLKYDPEDFQAKNTIDLKNYYTDMSRRKSKTIGNIETRGINWEHDLKKEQILVGDSLAISREQIERHNLTLLDEILFPDGSVAFRIVRTNQEAKDSN